MKRINITIDEKLLIKADAFSKKRFLSRSGLISLALSSYLDSVDAFSHKLTIGSVSSRIR